ncbi:MAG: GntR family transcriptional regulator [Acidobacteriota bacterium]
MSARPAAPRRETAAEEVYRALRRDLITLVHRPGAALTEQELAARYGTSRVPVREACRRLQQEGFLTGIPFKGYFVTPISAKEISDCFELRLALEGHALRLAIERADERAIARLETLAAKRYTSHDWASYTEFLERNLEFHLQLAALSGNERLVATLRSLLASMQRFFFLGLDLGDYGAEMSDEHRHLIAAVRQRRKREARECLERQIARSRERIVRALAERRVDLPLE